MIYRFAGCVLDTQIRELTDDGAPVHVEPQVFDVLLCLLENRDRVVSRDELVDTIWQGRAVSEATISARIWAARHATGDTGEAQGIIRTVPRRGFRFVAPVTAHVPREQEMAETIGAAPSRASQAASARVGLRVALAAAGILLLLVSAGAVTWNQLGHARLETASLERLAFPLPDKPSIAVLPFTNLSSGAAQGFMGEGLTESLINALARNPLLFVISHGSTSKYSGKAVAPKQAAEELGVRYIVEGSVKRAGDRVRVMTQLVDAIRGKVLWSDRFERPTDDLLALDEDITARIARSLDIRIIYGSDRASGGTHSLDAWGAYVRGRTEYLKFTQAGNSRAREHYMRAVMFDPNYAQAMVALAHSHLMEMAGAPAENWATFLNKIERIEDRVAEIAPRMPRLLDLRSLLALMEGDLDGALSEAESMVALDPNGAESHYALGRTYFFSGRYERAIESLEAAVRINPHSSASYSAHLAFSQLALGKTELAVSLLEAITKSSPDYSPAHAYLAIAYQLAGRDTQARRQAEHLPNLAPDVTVSMVERRFSPLRDRELADRIIEAARQAGIPG